MVDMSEPLVLLTITPTAQERILEVRAAEAEPTTLALWLEITGASGDAFTYDMYFRRLDEAPPDAAVQHGDDLSVVVPAEYVDQIRGATLDVGGSGMVITNPNTPAPPTPRMPVADLDLSDPIVAALVDLLEGQINPQLAAHGGMAQLVAVEVPTAYVRMGGGCQGCGLAAVTLSQGIETAIVEAIAEITEVVDVTDHASGTNPYYEASKK
jgi:Fe/S biogenesis protein NfuA